MNTTKKDVEKNKLSIKSQEHQIYMANPLM